MSSKPEQGQCRIYLAGPMSGMLDHNFPAFHDAARMLRAIPGNTVFNPAELKPGLKYREYLTIDLAWICTIATHIALLPGWRNSNGAIAEHATAIALGLGVIEL